MSKTINSFYTLFNNPFALSPIITSFYKNYNGTQKKDILLSYLILPICLYDPSKKGLQRANPRSALRTYVKEKERLYGLESRIQEFKNLTNLTLQLAIDQQMLTIEEDLSVRVSNQMSKEMSYDITPYTRAAANFAKLLRDSNIVSIYRQFGIKRL